MVILRRKVDGSESKRRRREKLPANRGIDTSACV